jgi:iron complex outermembrane receptor protein/vitamin B12 transporter
LIRKTFSAGRAPIGAACLLALAPLHAAWAQTGGEQITVTGTRLPTTAAGLAQNVTVFDQQAIQAMGVARIEDALARVTGAYVDQAGTAGGFTSVYIRGAENSHVLVMLDGVKLNDPTTTRGSAYDLSSIDISMVERIEVLRGPASAVYGGEALSGVIHIITRRPAPASGWSGVAQVGAGEDGLRRAGGAVGFGGAAVTGQLRAGHSEDGAGGDAGKLEQDTVHGTLRLHLTQAIAGEAFGGQVKRKGSALPDDSGGARLAVNRAHTTRDSTDTIYGVRFEAGEARLARVNAIASVFDRREHADNAFVDGGVRFPVPPFVSDTDFKRSNVTVAVTHEPPSGLFSLVAGVEWQDEDGSLQSVGDFFGAGSPQTLTFAMERDACSVFIEGRAQPIRGVRVQLGLRQDKVDGLAAVTTPHVGLLWDLGQGGSTVLEFTYGEGFKPPSFFALGFPIGANPNLRPERSKNAEAGVTHRLDGAGSSVKLGVFETRYRDLVDFDGATFTNINRGTIVVRGLEPELELRLSGALRAQLGATWLNIDARDGLQALRNRPEKRATAGLHADLGAWGSAFAGVRYTGTYIDRSNPTGDIAMPGYTVVDLAWIYRLLGRYDLKLGIDNALDKNYEQFVGFPAQGRRVRMEARASF